MSRNATSRRVAAAKITMGLIASAVTSVGAMTTVASASNRTTTLPNECRLVGTNGRNGMIRWARTQEVEGCAQLEAKIRFRDPNDNLDKTNTTKYQARSDVQLWVWSAGTPWSDHNGTHLTGGKAWGFRLAM